MQEVKKLNLMILHENTIYIYFYTEGTLINFIKVSNILVNNCGFWSTNDGYEPIKLKHSIITYFVPSWIFSLAIVGIADKTFTTNSFGIILSK